MQWITQYIYILPFIYTFLTRTILLRIDFSQIYIRVDTCYFIQQFLYIFIPFQCVFYNFVETQQKSYHFYHVNVTSIHTFLVFFLSKYFILKIVNTLSKIWEKRDLYICTDRIYFLLLITTICTELPLCLSIDLFIECIL